MDRTVPHDERETGLNGGAGVPALTGGEPGDIALTSKVPIPILIVDDKPKNLLAMVQMLEGLGEDIVQARSGADALRCLLRQEVAIVLLDVQMPDMDGYELAALIRQRERSRQTPIIFVTAFDTNSEDVSRGYALGAVDFVFKPIDPVVLRAKVSVFVDLFRKSEAMREQVKLERRLHLENLKVRTEKIEAEKALRQVEERQSLIIRSLPIALYTADLKGRFAGPRFLSESMAGAIGFNAGTFLDDGDLWSARIHPDDLPRVLSQVASIVEHGAQTMEYRWRCADGSERVFLDHAILVRDERGMPAEIVGTCLDITDRRRLERQLLHSQKMQAIGQLTGGIAHDFNNMLSVIIWNLESVTKSLKGSGKIHDRAHNALSAALNCAELVRQLLTFSRNQPHQAKVVDLAELVSRMARLLVPVIGEAVAIEIKQPEESWRIFADPAQIESALLNLAINARDAMPDGGALVIECANLHNESRDMDMSPGDYVVVSVADAGVGMAPDVLERAIEPFYTTKEPGKGSGLGLSMVYGFVKQTGGHIRIDSTVGKGTTVRLYLPRTETVSIDDELAEGDGDPAFSLAGRSILVVEDDINVLGITVARLEELGVRVLEASSALSALDILHEKVEIDLLFTDVVMPGGMSGLDLARRALELRPEIKLLFASGYASTFYTTGGVLGELLAKPYNDEDLIGALKRVFGARSAAAPVAEAG